MEFLEKIFKKKFRILYKDIDIAFQKNASIIPVEDEDVDDTFYTFGFVPVEYTVMYSLVLPAVAEERVDEIVKDFISSNEPSDINLKIDYAFVKEKGKLKVLIGVLKEEDYQKLRGEFYEISRTLSGILPYQLILIAYALKNGVKDGLAVFKKDGYILGFLLRNGFPVSFLKVKERESIKTETVVNRFLSSERVEDDFKTFYFGSDFEDLEESENTVIVRNGFNLAEAFSFLIDSKSIPVVNFLPVKERKVIRRWWRYIVAAIVILGLLGYSGMFLKDYFSLRKEVNELKANFEVKKKQALKLRKKLGDFDKFKSMVSYFNNLDKNKRKMLVLLEELTRKIPKDAYLTRVSITDKGTIEINGKAKDVYAVVKALNNSKYFKNVEKKSSRQSGDYTIFIIGGKVVY